MISCRGCTHACFGDYNELVYLRARMYAPGIGRFLTRDIWSGDANSPMSYNVWLYVENNPINKLDPSGYCIYNENGICIPGGQQGITSPTPDPYADHPTREPAAIVWSPSVSANTLWLKYPNGNLVPPGTTFSQHFVKNNNGEYITGACGPLTVAAIAYYSDPQGLITQIYNSGLSADYVGAETLKSIIKNLPGSVWDAYIIRNIPNENASSVLREALSKHHFPIPGVRISGSTGIVGKGNAGHWLAVTGLSIDYQWSKGKDWQWVRVFNPFNNQNEYYMWSWFSAAWGGGNDFSPSKLMVAMCSRAPFTGIPNSTC